MIPSSVLIWTLEIPEKIPLFLEGELFSLLSSFEKNRYHKMGSPKRKREYLLGHGLARMKMAEVLGCIPVEVPLKFEEGKRPEHQTSNTEIQMYLSISHTDDLLALAIAPCPLGVDVESTTKSRSYREIAGSYFTPQEVSYIFGSHEVVSKVSSLAHTHFDPMGLAEGETFVSPIPFRFQQIWTVKEAFYKASNFSIERVGTQLIVCPRMSSDVSFLVPEMAPQELKDEMSCWQAQLFYPSAHHVGAVVSQSDQPVKIVCHEISVSDFVDCQNEQFDQHYLIKERYAL